MSHPNLADQVHRNQALDIAQSYSVQAPAGSGKTELLSLRYLKLLSISKQPEEVLAITFTRKAASEMRDRIIKSIAWAASFDTDKEPIFSDDLESKRFEIANAALKQNNRLKWHVLENPSRLRVQTIDSFCHYLSSQLPVLSRLGGSMRVSEEVEHIFADAVGSTLSELESDSSISDDIAMLLRHLDNDTNKIERLLVGLLYKRDQWLPHILGIRAEVLIDKAYLQESLEQLITESFEEVTAALLPYESELIELANFAAENLQQQNLLEIEDFIPFSGLPDTNFQTILYWRFLVNLLVTQAGTWRLTADKRIGFPAGDKSDKDFDDLCKKRKKQLAALKEHLIEDDDLLESLTYLRRLPDPRLEQQQWGFLSAIARVLALLNAKLLLSFRKFRTIDHPQTGAAARDALVDENAPTDLALALDHKIQHILVDEFQDTSKLQIDILEQLITGWQPNDGRTLFVVGDAMQSCYGFRNANVGLFLKVREGGLGDTLLTPLTLTTNFRSQANIVNWVNSVFSCAFPRQANSSRGAVPYNLSVAYKAPEPDADIKTELIVYEKGQRNDAKQLEAAKIVEQIVTLRQQNSGATIAVLVRNRTHLAPITTALRSANIQWQSTDIDRLESLPPIQDLTNLTRALLNLTDRVAWLALLRAPWCGLDIADLHAIDSFAGTNSIWFALQQIQDIDRLTPESQSRLSNVYRIVDFALSKRYRCRLRQLVETTWTLLRGPSAVSSESELLSIAHFFSLLDEKETAGSIDDIAEFEAKVASAFVPSKIDQENPNTIHIMTMHKAKGLEFDHIILPGLAHEPKSNDKPLLQWHERLNEHGESRLFIATLSASGSDDGDLYNLLRHEQKHKTSLEDTRLLYIAATRAKQSLCLFATVQLNAKGKVEPAKNSLLKRIWRELSALPEHEVGLTHLGSTATDNQQTYQANSNSYPAVTPIMRLNQPIQLNQEESLAIDIQDVTEQEEAKPEEPGATLNESAAAIGTLIHSTLEAIVNSHEAALTDERLDNLRRYWRLQLGHRFDNEEDLKDAVGFIETSIVNSVASKTDGWIFDPDLEDSSSELGLTRQSDNYTANFSVDRSFIDPQGTRWIIDYKTAKCAKDQSLDDFVIEQSKSHQSQLDNYKNLFKQIEERPVKTALFLTSIAKLVELS